MQSYNYYFPLLFIQFLIILGSLAIS